MSSSPPTGSTDLDGFLGQLEYTKVIAAWTSFADPFFTLQEHIGQHAKDGEEAKNQEYLGHANEDSSWHAGMQPS